MKSNQYLHIFLCLLLIVLALSACSSGDNQPTAVPTDPPPTRTPFPTFAFVEPTKAPIFDESTEETAETTEDAAPIAIELDPKKVERGLGRYQALECGNCHGASGEGSDQGISLLDFALSEGDFITFVRSGGDLGPSHQYSTDRLSNSGSRNLYHYLLSLAQGS